MKLIVLSKVEEETTSYIKERIANHFFKSLYTDVYYMYHDADGMWQGYDPYKDSLVFLNTCTFEDAAKHFRKMVDIERCIRMNYI